MTQEMAHIFLEVVGKKEVLDLHTKGIQLIEIIILQKSGDDENPIREMGEKTVEISKFSHLRCALNALQLRGQKVQFVSCGPSLMYVFFVVGKAMFLFFVFWRLQLSDCKKNAPCFFFDFVEISAVVFLQV